MITAAEFKKQVGKYFGQEMRKLGFKGTGFDYFQETTDFLFAFTIGGKTGASGVCSVSMAAHPKIITINTHDDRPLNFKKLAFYHYEFRMSLIDEIKKFWHFSDKEEDNFRTINEILDLIKSHGLPVFEQFKSGLLESFRSNDMDTFFDTFRTKTGVRHIGTSEMRFAWIMTLYYENKNLERAKEFAAYGLEKLGDSDWFARKDWQRVMDRDIG